ncbi:pirin family protein [Sulfurospirillum arcachonense]|uniref:pirin family protein n=1 Tax=Sulfurospirillum arcachonense TaxID=57666 RepID=UPI000469BB99|nr:pirin-like bicupin family protein [Sulfurospirillum arcachonense]
MLKKLSKENMGASNLGWLESRFHFSFAEYRNPKNINFGALRVLNDDIIHPQGGFAKHPHKDMEIISYVVDGEITHKDSMGNEKTLKRGEVQYMSAGTGVMHSEYNLSKTEDLRLLQIWILPPQKNMQTLYGSHRYKENERQNRLLNIVSSLKGDAKVKIHQDIEIYVSETTQEIQYSIKKDKQIYFVQIEGESLINEQVSLSAGDAMEITDENLLHVKPLGKIHFLFIELKSEF